MWEVSVKSDCIPFDRLTLIVFELQYLISLSLYPKNTLTLFCSFTISAWNLRIIFFWLSSIFKNTTNEGYNKDAKNLDLTSSFSKAISTTL